MTIQFGAVFLPIGVSKSGIRNEQLREKILNNLPNYDDGDMEGIATPRDILTTIAGQGSLIDHRDNLQSDELPDKLQTRGWVVQGNDDELVCSRLKELGFKDMTVFDTDLLKDAFSPNALRAKDNQPNYTYDEVLTAKPRRFLGMF